MKFLKNPILENYAQPHPVQLDEIETMYETAVKAMPTEFKVSNKVLDSFMIKDDLNPEIWKDGKIIQPVRRKLVKIAHDFFKGLELDPKIRILDIIMVGSLANYNWSKYSDVDLHVVVDFNKFDDKDLVKKAFDAFKNLYNLKHNIKIGGYDVEVYVQDIKEKLSAAAVYSLLHDKWILKPKNVDFKLDKSLIRRKVKNIFDTLKKIKNAYTSNDFQKTVDDIDALKDNLKKMRKSGLERGGEFSTENIVYKILRRTDIMELLDTYKNKAYDQLVTIP